MSKCPASAIKGHDDIFRFHFHDLHERFCISKNSIHRFPITCVKGWYCVEYPENQIESVYYYKFLLHKLSMLNYELRVIESYSIHKLSILNYELFFMVVWMLHMILQSSSQSVIISFVCRSVRYSESRNSCNQYIVSRASL